jgi:hypothetical protein
MRDSIGPYSFSRGAAVSDIFPFWALSCLYYLQNEPFVMVFNSSLLRVAGSQPAAATDAIARTCLMSPHASNLWQCIHSSWHGRQERTSALLCFRPWRCLEVKSCSCKRWMQQAVCPSRLLNLISQVSAECSQRRWNSCPFRYLWKCSSVLMIASSSCWELLLCFFVRTYVPLTEMW